MEGPCGLRICYRFIFEKLFYCQDIYVYIMSYKFELYQVLFTLKLASFLKYHF